MTEKPGASPAFIKFIPPFVNPKVSKYLLGHAPVTSQVTIRGIYFIMIYSVSQAPEGQKHLMDQGLQPLAYHSLR